MKRMALKATLVGVGIITSLVAGYGQAAWAGTLHNGWNYAIDSFNDGTEGRKLGENSKFEFYGMAMKQTRQKVYFAFSSNLTLDGYNHHKALNGNVSYGDLFLNFDNQTSISEANGSLHGIRFSDINDSQDYDIENGVYEGVTGVGLMRKNLGHADLLSYSQKVQNRGGDASFGDLGAETAYFNHDDGTPHDDGTTMNNKAYGYTNISDGTRLGGVEMLNNLSGLGLDFAHFNAEGANSQMFAFRVDRDALPTGDFIAHLFAECDNDGLALAGTLADVPEPSTMISLALFGLVGAGYRRMKGAKA